MFVGTIGTIGRVQGAAVAATTTWNPAFNTNYTYSNGNRTYQGTADQTARGNNSRNSGVVYFEVTPSAANQASIGIVNSNVPFSEFPGQNASNGQMIYGANFYGTGASGASVTLNNGETVGLKLDFPNATATYYARNQVYRTAPLSSNGGPFFPASDGSIGGTQTINTGQDAFVYGLPSGATAWG